jgi:broad specificity phosphatase PhoE
VAVVCHGGNVRAALMATPMPLEDGPDPRRAPIPNASVTALQVNSAGLRATMIADASHLA